MNKFKIPHSILLALLVFCSFTSELTTSVQAKQPNNHAQKDSDQKGVVRGIPILWEDPGQIEGLDLYYGTGGADGAPDLSEDLTYVSDLAGGTSKKILVQDKQKRKWVVKFGPEAKPETVATRIVSAMGYRTDLTYFVKHAHIIGEKTLDAENVRFERRPDGYEEIGTWSWDQNPFNEKHEMEGLKILMALLNNWDLKRDNNSIICQKKTQDVSEGKCFFYVSDLGATFGSTGSIKRKILRPFDPPAGSKGKPDDYASQSFIEGTREGKIVFHYKGKDPDSLKGLSVESARWIGDMLARLSEKQLSDAFRAGGYEGAENTEYVEALRERIKELQQVGGSQLSEKEQK